MRTITTQLQEAFRSAIAAAFGIEADPLVAPAASEQFGDYQSNAAMSLAKALGTGGRKMPPREVAGRIRDHLNIGHMAEVEIAGPGFINLKLKSEWIASQLAAVCGDERLGIERVSPVQRVVVDYSSPNVAKEMHVGHLRSTNIGDAISRILEFQGHQVIRQNHLGDWGTQFGMLLTYLRSCGSAADAQLADLEQFYRAAKKRFDEDPAFADESRRAVVRLQAGGQQELSAWRRIVDESRRHFQNLYKRMNVRLSPADERGESFYNPLLPDVVRELLDRGVAVESQGAVVVFVEGFEAPLIVRKSDGGFGYATTDLAALRYRARELGAQRVIYVTDARQMQHFAQVFATARRAGWVDGVQMEHVVFGSILGADGKPLKTREGETVKLKDVLDEAESRAHELVTRKNPSLSSEQRLEIARAVGIGAVKYFDLARDRTGDYVFDWDKMLALDGNTAPYLQYAYARIRSIFRRQGAAAGPNAGAGRGGGEQVPTIVLTTPFEVRLATHILRLGEVLAAVSRELKPHHLCNYLYELAVRFSGFYENCPVIQSEEPVKSSRLVLCDVTARALALGLDLLGIEHPEQM